MSHARTNPHKNTSIEGATGGGMGPQSQRRISLQQRTFQIAGNNNRKRKGKPGEQLTLFGDKAFDALVDCVNCRAKAAGRDSHKGHDIRCIKNWTTKGVVSAATVAQLQMDKRLKKHYETPLKESEKASF